MVKHFPDDNVNASGGIGAPFDMLLKHCVMLTTYETSDS
jgi:hypothetical protein